MHFIKKAFFVFFLSGSFISAMNYDHELEKILNRTKEKNNPQMWLNALKSLNLNSITASEATELLIKTIYSFDVRSRFVQLSFLELTSLGANQYAVVNKGNNTTIALHALLEFEDEKST
jgi:hypothetical protein